MLANETLGERRCIFFVSDVLRSDPDPVEIACGIPRPGRADRRLGLAGRRSAQSRLAGEGEQGLRELTLEDALQDMLERADQGRQRQAAMGDPCRRDQELSGDVR